MPTNSGKPSPQDAPVVTSMTGRKIFVTSTTPGEPEGNIDPSDLGLQTTAQTGYFDDFENQDSSPQGTIRASKTGWHYLLSAAGSSSDFVRHENGYVNMDTGATDFVYIWPQHPYEEKNPERLTREGLDFRAHKIGCLYSLPSDGAGFMPIILSKDQDFGGTMHFLVAHNEVVLDYWVDGPVQNNNTINNGESFQIARPAWAALNAPDAPKRDGVKRWIEFTFDITNDVVVMEISGGGRYEFPFGSDSSATSISLSDAVGSHFCFETTYKDPDYALNTQYHACWALPYNANDSATADSSLRREATIIPSGLLFRGLTLQK